MEFVYEKPRIDQQASANVTDVRWCVHRLETRTITKRVTKGHQIVVHMEFSTWDFLTIKQRNQIILRTIVDFTSM